jgi:hypothetical protein
MKDTDAYDLLRNFVKEICTKAGQANDFDDAVEIMDLNTFLRDKTEALDSFYLDMSDDAEYFRNIGCKLVDGLDDIGEIWKYSMIFQTLADSIELSEALNEVIYKFYLSTAGSSEEAHEKFNVAIENRNLTNSDIVKTKSDIDFVIGWFCLAIEVSINDGDEDGIRTWVTGFGNCFGFENDVSDTISTLDFEFRDWLLEEYMKFMFQYFKIDTFSEGEYRSEDEGVDWNAVSKGLNAFL